MMSAEDIDKAMERHGKELLALPGVVGVARGLCRDIPCLKVYVSVVGPGLKERVAEILEGVPAVIEQSGSFQAL
ncbi:MAG: hypothetical protein RQ753_09645 [Desulfurivibrionaceae bacterium]|nr:hypothetical protein [Desulfobulbales bacterium]MDT8335950.1 hypothetical protein [Desulfurivibrionaceae bacterium]